MEGASYVRPGGHSKDLSLIHQRVFSRGGTWSDLQLDHSGCFAENRL